MKGRRRIVLGVALIALLVILGASGAVVASPSNEEPEASFTTAATLASPATEGPGADVARGEVASRINYQGLLTDAEGNPLNGAVEQMVFQLWDAPEGGNPVGVATEKLAVPVSNGLFSVELNVSQDDFNGQALWLQVEVNEQPLWPRQELLPVPYALSLKPGATILSSGPTTLHVHNESGGYGVEGWSQNNIGLLGVSGPILYQPSGMHGVHGLGDGTGVHGEGGHIGVYGIGNDDGVKGESPFGNGVHGLSTSGNAVLGVSTDGNGVRGESGTEHGIVGKTDAGGRSGVYGWSASGKGIEGFTTSSNEWIPAIYGRNEGSGDGVYGWSKNRHGTVGVTSSSNAADAGVWATNNGVGPGILADSGSNGYAAIFKGNVQVCSSSTGATVIELGEGLDYAEGFDVSDETDIVPGTVLIIDPNNPGELAISTEAYDRKVAGIVAGAKGMGSAVRLGSDEFDFDVALAGRVYCNVDATYGEVSPGDLLTTSPTPGYAMVVTDYAKAQGAILGKAMESLEQGERGQILVLVTLQ